MNIPVKTTRECLYHNSTSCTWYPNNVTIAMQCSSGPTISTKLEHLATSSLRVKFVSDVELKACHT